MLRSDTDTINTLLEDSSSGPGQPGEGHSFGWHKGAQGPFELTSSDCSMRPLIIIASRRSCQRIRGQLSTDHQRPHRNPGLQDRGPHDAVKSTWRDPQFEFYLVSAHLCAECLEYPQTITAD